MTCEIERISCFSFKVKYEKENGIQLDIWNNIPCCSTSGFIHSQIPYVLNLYNAHIKFID